MKNARVIMGHRSSELNDADDACCLNMEEQMRSRIITALLVVSALGLGACGEDGEVADEVRHSSQAIERGATHECDGQVSDIVDVVGNGGYSVGFLLMCQNGEVVAIDPNDYTPVDEMLEARDKLETSIIEDCGRRVRALTGVAGDGGYTKGFVLLCEDGNFVSVNAK